MADCESQFDLMSQKLARQEIRIQQRALEELRKEYETLKAKEHALVEGARWERERLRSQEEMVVTLRSQNERLEDQVADQKKEIESLQNQLKKARRISAVEGARTQLEFEVINYRAKVAGLESKLAHRQSEYEKTEDALRGEIERLSDQLMLQEVKSEPGVFNEKENMEHIDKLNEMHYRVGSLTATNEALRSEVERHLADKAELEHEVKLAKDDIESVKNINKALQEQLKETEGSSDVTSKFWAEEVAKIRAQKAEIRCELLRLKREHGNLLKSNHDAESCTKEIAELKQELAESKSKVVEVERKFAEAESTEKGKMESLSRDFAEANEKIAKLQTALSTVDGQAEDMITKLRAENASKKTARKKVAELEEELARTKIENDNRKALEEEVASLKAENDRLIEKVSYLENEIRETHTDHREELAKLAQQLTSVRQQNNAIGQRQSEELSKKVMHLEATIRQNESVIRSLQRSVDQHKAEVVTSDSTSSELRNRQLALTNENTELRKALNDAIIKIKSQLEKTQVLTTENDELQAKLEKLTETNNKLRDEISDKRDELEQKAENIAYLQSIMQPRKLEKLKVSQSQSTLVTGADDDYADLDDLVVKRNQLAREVSQRLKVLEQKRSETMPLLKASSLPMTAEETEDDASSVSSSRTQLRVGTMRHNIPHRWSKCFIVVIAPKCDSCHDALPRFTYSLRCKDCNLYSHYECRKSISNTCGLPSACAHYYVDHHNMSGANLQSWVKVWRSDRSNDRRWRNAYAVIEGNCINFFDSDQDFANGGDPRMTVDLAQERWRIYKQTGRLDFIESENVDNLIEIKMQNCSLYMLTLSPESKGMWMLALQSAADRKILERNASSKRIMNLNVLMRITESKLKIQSTEFFQDWLLIGTPQGLFVMNYSNPRMPHQIAGCSHILQLKYIKEQGLLFAIDGIDRNLIVMSEDQLSTALNACHAPRIQPFAYRNIPAAHLIEVSEPNHSAERYVYIGTSEGIVVLHYVAKKDMFVFLTEIRLDVPAMCLLSVAGGFVFGSDTFYSVKVGEWVPRPFRCDWPPDAPVGIVRVSEQEILIVNHNCGVFTTPEGVRTRPGLVEWERAPISVHYIDSHLFIVYTDMTSIARVLSRRECTEESVALVQEVEGYRAPGVRVTGPGRHSNELIVSVMNEACVELNCFSTNRAAVKASKQSTSTLSGRRRP